ncbi:MAG: flagellar assembly protein FliH [Chromatiales bacterium]
MKNSSRIIPRAKLGELDSFRFADISDPNQPRKAGKPKTQAPQLTAADLEKIQQQAREEAYEQGRKEGFEFGHKEALEQFREQFAEKLQQLEQIITTFEQPFLDLDKDVETEIVDLVVSMTKQLIRREIKLEPNHIIGVVREALAILPVGSRNVSVILNPEDAALIREVYSMDEKEQSWKIIEDPVLNRGGCKVQTETSQVDATLESRLDALIAPLLSEERNQSNKGEGTD